MLISTVLLAALRLGSPLATPPTDAILAEGLRLYQSERSSWVATDLILATQRPPITASLLKLGHLTRNSSMLHYLFIFA